LEVDVIASSIDSSDELPQLSRLLQVIPTKIILISAPSTISRQTLCQGLGYETLSESYAITVSSLIHHQFGGATPALWRFALLSHRTLNWKHPSIRGTALPPVTIFNMIDDKIGGGFKPIPQRAYKTLRDSSEQGWDLGLDPNTLEYWTKARVRQAI
jgi:hypothetical protein